MKKSTDALSEPFPTLIDTIRSNHPETGGEYRGAVAELLARLALAQDKTAQRIGIATWALVFATIALVLVTITK